MKRVPGPPTRHANAPRSGGEMREVGDDRCVYRLPTVPDRRAPDSSRPVTARELKAMRMALNKEDADVFEW